MKELQEQNVTLISSKLLMCRCGLLASIIFLEPAKKKKDKEDLDYTSFCTICWNELRHEYENELRAKINEIDNR